ncbi:hypothetical protein SAMN05216323_102135 [Williamwhitmania taraxaci]|uniref:Uncharacterized protein n=1 Tax=Williamwhitmania taraxaci TaxID=1640674 RepID=A0A1G6JSD8_9BACT|nr:hypothetical protein SAMN05216323_102135 [Williamwhitmania taraxaci]
MKSISENIANNHAHSAWLFRFGKGSIYTFLKAWGTYRWECNDSTESTFISAFRDTPIRKRGLQEKYPKLTHLISVEHILRSMATDRCLEIKEEPSSLPPFQAFPPKCNTQLVYGKGRRNVDLFFCANKSRNI